MNKADLLYHDAIDKPHTIYSPFSIVSITSLTRAHNHLDQGSFSFSTAGAWYAEDLGSDSYTLPSYFGPNRWVWDSFSGALY